MTIETGLVLVAVLLFFWGYMRFQRWVNKKYASYRKDPRYQRGRAAARARAGWYKAAESSPPFLLGFEEERDVMEKEEHAAWRQKHGDYDD